MNCEAALLQIYEGLDRELTPAEQAALKAHLEECADCLAEQTLLARDRRMLASVETPDVRLNAAQIYQGQMIRWRSSQRRWRRGAVAAIAASLLLMMWLGAGMRVEVGASGLAVVWRESSIDADHDAAAGSHDVDQVSAELQKVAVDLARQQRRLDDLNQLVALVAAEIDNSRVRERRAILAAVDRKLEAERRANDTRMKTLGRSVHMLHLTQLTDAEPIGGGGP